MTYSAGVGRRTGDAQRYLTDRAFDAAQSLSARKVPELKAASQPVAQRASGPVDRTQVVTMFKTPRGAKK